MEKNLKKEFGEHLKSLRISRNLSQVELAFKGDFDRNYIGMLERGERNPSLKNLKRLSIALDISLSELLNFENNDKNK
jgi:transcriptional regulator with XRE-family HTH domain